METENEDLQSVPAEIQEQETEVQAEESQEEVAEVRPKRVYQRKKKIVREETEAEPPAEESSQESPISPQAIPSETAQETENREETDGQTQFYQPRRNYTNRNYGNRNYNTRDFNRNGNREFREYNNNRGYREDGQRDYTRNYRRNYNYDKREPPLYDPQDSADDSAFESKPKLMINELTKLSMPNLRNKAIEYGVPEEELPAMKKQELIFVILKAHTEHGGIIFASGALEIMPDGYGFLRSPQNTVRA